MGYFTPGAIVYFFAENINTVIVFLFFINGLIFVNIIHRVRGIRKFIDEIRIPENLRHTPDTAGETYLERLKRTYIDWGERYRNINPWVHYYSILTTIFPLLGILGTVCALLQVRGDFSNVKGGFMLALSSTFWGLVAAIVSKAGEGFFSPDIDRFKVIYEIFTKDMMILERTERNGVMETDTLTEHDA